MFTEEIAKVFTQSCVIDMENVHEIDDESRHEDFLTTSEVYKNKKREYIWSVFNIFRMLIKEHSDEILNVRCFDF